MLGRARCVGASPLRRHRPRHAQLCQWGVQRVLALACLSVGDLIRLGHRDDDSRSDDWCLPQAPSSMLLSCPRKVCCCGFQRASAVWCAVLPYCTVVYRATVHQQ